MQLETTVTMPLIQMLNALGNIVIFGLAMYVRFQINKLESKILSDDVKLEEKILSIVNGKYLKTQVYEINHANLLEKLDSAKHDVSKLCDKIDKYLDHSNERFEHIEKAAADHNIKVDKKMLKLAAIPCPFQDKKKFLLEED